MHCYNTGIPGKARNEFRVKECCVMILNLFAGKCVLMAVGIAATCIAAQVYRLLPKLRKMLSH